MDKNIEEEVAWLNQVALKYLKNYQIWYMHFTPLNPEKTKKQTNIIRHHRQVLMSSRQHFPTLPPKELDFLMEMFAQDSKNYHVWTYRHWLVRHFKLWDLSREIEDVNVLLKADVRNNSAWSHRYTLRFGPRADNEHDAGMVNAGDMSTTPAEKGVLAVVDEDMIDGELAFAQEAIVRAPENRSPWWYARGVLLASGRSLSEWEEFAGKFVISEDLVKSSHAVEWLADVYAADEKKRKAVEMFGLLEKYDPIRKNYWYYRVKQLGEIAV
jgi:protein farnesyltransferase/geranylgeranyltransferase type-1 subunit alpha